MPKLYLFLALLSIGLWADNRSFVWTYEAETMAPGEAEFEHYYTVQYSDRSNLDRDYRLVHDFELEIGMTRVFDVGIYQQFSQSKNDALTYEQFKIRFRYRLPSGSAFGATPLLYLEYKSSPSFQNQVLEGKLVLSRQTHSFIGAINPGLEWNVSNRGWETFYSAGLSYVVSPLLKLGVEIKGNDEAHYLGPVLSHGNDKRYIAIGSGFNIYSTVGGKPEFMIRSIIGIRL